MAILVGRDAAAWAAVAGQQAPPSMVSLVGAINPFARFGGTITDGSEPVGTLDMMATAWNRTGSTLTNHLVIMPVWASGTQDGGAAEWVSGDSIQLYADSGGSPGTEIANYQLNNPAGDRAGNKRLGFLTFIETFTASQEKNFHAVATQGSPPTGTELTVANVKSTLDAMTTATDGLKAFIDIGGTDYQVLLNDLVNSPTTTWSKSSASRWVNSDDGKDWWYGPTCNTFLLNSPFKAVSGGAAHASGDGMHLEVELTAYKASSGAFNISTNPILGLFGTAIIHNVSGDTDYTVADFKIERATSIADGTLISTGDACWLDQHTNDYDFTGESFTAWRGGKFGITFAIGKKPILALPGDHTISAGLPTTNAMMTAAAAARLTPYYPRTFGNVTHETERFPNIQDKPFTVNSGGSYIGSILLDMPSGSGRMDFGLMPLWCQNGLLRPDNGGMQRIFRNANAWGTLRYIRHARNPDSGFLMPEPQSGQTNRSTSESASDPWTYDGDHQPHPSFLAYIMAGRHYDYDTMACWPVGRGVGLAANVTVVGNATSSVWAQESGDGAHWYFFQSRGIGRTFNGISNIALVTPDRQLSTDIIGPSKDSWFLSVERTFTRAATCITRGFTIGQYATGSNLRWIEFVGNNYQHTYWAFAEVAHAVENSMRHGMGDTNSATWGDWCDELYAGYIERLPKVWPWAIAQYRDRYKKESDGSGTQIKTIVDFYNELAARKAISSEYNWTRQAIDNVVLTLSTTSGAGIIGNFTLNSASHAMIDPAYDSWYVDKFLQQHSGGNDSFGPGYARITAINSASQIVMSTLATGGAAFNATTLTHERWTLPPPHPDETKPFPIAGYGVNRLDNDYMPTGKGYLGLRADRGITKCVNAYNTVSAAYPNSAGGHYHQYAPTP